MTIRGIQVGGLIELCAIVLIGAFIALLTLMPWWLAVVVYLAFWVVAVRLLRWERRRHERRIRHLEEWAQLERRLLRSERERSNALRPRGGACR